jgi:two-component system C4-dicarboxylate transport sensor histidine kinase DctB
MNFRLRPLYAVLALALICSAALGARQATWQAGLAEMQVKGGDQLALHRRGLETVVERYRYLPFLLAQDATIRDLLRSPDDAALIRAANAYLASANEASGANALYVMSAEGLTLASSNHAEPTSFVGHSYAFRPYFQDAMKRGQGRFYAVGVTTNQPGYFLSHRISDGDRALGVAVVKVDLRPIEAGWRAAGDSIAVLDGSGIAFLASIDAWKYRPLKPLGPEALASVTQARQYRSSDLLSRSLLDDGSAARDGALVAMQQRDDKALSPSVLFHSLPLPDHGWTMIAATELPPLAERANLVAAVTALTLALLGLAGLFLMQRRQLIRAKLDAHAILERRVDERTRELRNLNQELAREVDVRRRAEDELKQAQSELIQAAKLAALGQMSAAIVHEVSQPLATIEIYLASTRLLLQHASTEAVAANLEIISELAARMRRMARSLKSFARKEEAGSEAMDLGVVARASIEMMRGRFESEGIAVSFENDAGAAIVMMNRVRAEQILANLLDNAIDALHGRETKTIRVTLAHAGGEVRLNVADSGEGIPSHLRERIMEPFFSSKKAGEGLGLGLFICETIIADAGGRLSVADGETGGAVFTVSLPLRVMERQQAAE